MKSSFLIRTVILVLIILTIMLLVSCGIPQSELDTAVAEKNTLQSELNDIMAVYPLNGFETLTEFKDWISAHVQPETTYIDDAFLAAYKVQQAGMSDGYLMGIDIDTDIYSSSVFISVFIGNELYWWFVEDKELYGSYDLIR